VRPFSAGRGRNMCLQADLRGNRRQPSFPSARFCKPEVTGSIPVRSTRRKPAWVAGMRFSLKQGTWNIYSSPALFSSCSPLACGESWLQREITGCQTENEKNFLRERYRILPLKWRFGQPRPKRKRTPTDPRRRTASPPPRGWDWGELTKLVHRRDRTCVVCGGKDRLQVRHRIPLTDGGANQLSNLELRCAAHHRQAPARPQPAA
jgi:5-methylcytosine-specific restriction endonuclease McrA